MGWSLTGNQWQNYDWQSIALLGEIYAAWNERRAVLGQSPVSLPAAGDDVQHINIYKSIQDWIIEYHSYFVQSHNVDGTSRATDYYNGIDIIRTWSYPNFMRSCRGGETMTDFPRAVDMPSNWENLSDSNYKFGRMANGDIIGPWLPLYIQKAFNRLIWTVQGVYTNRKISPHPTNLLGRWVYDRHYDSYVGESDTRETENWDLVKSECEASWKPESEASSVNEATLGPYAVTYGGLGFHGFYANAERRRMSIRVKYLPTIGREIDFYISSGVYQDGDNYYFIWDNNGEDVVQGVWHLFESGGFSTASQVDSSRVGGNTFPAFPNWCDSPLSGSGSFTNANARGFITRDNIYYYTGAGDGGAAICRWNVAGGFEYV